MVRKYVPSGRKPPGGARDGAGRPEGITGKRPLGNDELAAIKALRYNVPEGTPDILADIAAETFSTMCEIFRFNTDPFQSGNALKAATRVREEICGPVAQKHEVTGANGGPMQVSISINGKVPK